MQNNDSFNKTTWQFALKHIFSSSKIIQILTYIATCIFNEDFNPFLRMMKVMGIKIAMHAQQFAETCDAERIMDAERRTFEFREKEWLADKKNKYFCKL